MLLLLLLFAAMASYNYSLFAAMAITIYYCNCYCFWKSVRLYDYMNKKFGQPHTTKGWVGLEFVREEEEEDIIANLT